MAPDCLADLPKSVKVFIGGSSGKIAEILKIVHKKNSKAEIVITAVSLETLNEANSVFDSFGADNPEVVQLAVTRTKKLGEHTMLSAENPVFIIKGALI